MSNESTTNNQVDLKKEIELFIVTYRKRHRHNFHMNIIIILIGLLLTVGVTLAGILDEGKIAATFGVFIAFLIGIQNAFPLSEKAEFYRLIIAECENLISDLKYKGKSDKDKSNILERFQTIRTYAATNLPRGQGMQTVKAMYEDLQSKGTINQNL